MPSHSHRRLVAFLFAAALAGGPAMAQQPPMPAVAPTPPEKPLEVTVPAPAANPAPGEPSTNADDPAMRRVAACKDRALARLKEQSPSVEDLYFDVDGLTIAQARSKLGDTEVRGVIMGEAYIKRDRSDRANRFLCLTGADGEVIFTFFTER
jgi:hypothetical protein